MLFCYQSVAYAACGEFTQAIKHANRAVALAPKNVRCLEIRAALFMELDQLREAIADYSEWLELNPRAAGAYVYRSVAWESKGNHTKARADFDKAVELARGEAYEKRGHRYAAVGRMDSALADFGALIWAQPQNALARVWRGSAYARNGQLDRALDDVSEALRLDPRCAPAFSERAYVLIAKGQCDAAVADCSESIRLQPINALAFAIRGMAYARKKDYRKALSDLSEAIRLQPAVASYLHERAAVYRELGNPRAAAADEERAAQLVRRLAGVSISVFPVAGY